MAKINYQLIDLSNRNDLGLKNEPFELFGRMKISRLNNNWSYEVEMFSHKMIMVFPDETYHLQEINQSGFALGAYDDSNCVGLAIYQNHWNKYLYLKDLKINMDHRMLGIGNQLINEGFRRAIQSGYMGIYTVCQDNNLAACQFYLKIGFHIGGFNDFDYNYTNQSGKSDIYFYLDKK
ncbi:GNAT family N-acetyltransferase [Oenococcus sp. UCMA 14587]|nr:GNAT family N-acetyltransferase [Oenococcus sp. UCMA 14587]